MSDEGTALIRDCIAAGVDATLIARISVLAARLMELDRRRAADANRQRKHRHVTSRLSRDSCDVTPPVYISTPPEKKPKKVSSLCMIPDDWQPDRAFARKRGWSEDRISSQAERFRDYALAKGRKQRDWAAAWRNWVTSPYQSNQGGGNGRVQDANNVINAADRLLERVRQFDEPPPSRRVLDGARALALRPVSKDGCS